MANPGDRDPSPTAGTRPGDGHGGASSVVFAARDSRATDVVALNSDASGACPSWSRVFLRDFHKFVDGGRHVRHYAPCVQPALDDDHPCKGATSLQCRRRFVAATCL